MVSAYLYLVLCLADDATQDQRALVSWAMVHVVIFTVFVNLMKQTIADVRVIVKVIRKKLIQWKRAKKDVLYRDELRTEAVNQ